MNKTKLIKTALATAALILTLGFTSCQKDKGNTLTCTPSSVNVSVGKTVTSSITKGTAPYSVSSSDSKVATATVSSSTVTVTGVAEGKATITVKDKNAKTASIAVTVKK